MAAKLFLFIPKKHNGQEMKKTSCVKGNYYTDSIKKSLKK
jgi:hypothetical protein